MNKFLTLLDMVKWYNFKNIDRFYAQIMFMRKMDTRINYQFYSDHMVSLIYALDKLQMDIETVVNAEDWNGYPTYPCVQFHTRNGGDISELYKIFSKPDCKISIDVFSELKQSYIIRYRLDAFSPMYDVNPIHCAEIEMMKCADIILGYFIDNKLTKKEIAE